MITLLHPLPLIIFTLDNIIISPSINGFNVIISHIVITTHLIILQEISETMLTLPSLGYCLTHFGVSSLATLTLLNYHFFEDSSEFDVHSGHELLLYNDLINNVVFLTFHIFMQQFKILVQDNIHCPHTFNYVMIGFIKQPSTFKLELTRCHIMRRRYRWN